LDVAQITQLTSKLREAETKLATAHSAWVINNDELAIQRIVGQGSFGTVSSAIWRGSMVAVKQLGAASDTALHELAIMQCVHTHTHTHTLLPITHLYPWCRTLRPHANLVQFLGYCKTHQSLMLVCEFLPNGSVETHLKRLTSLGKLLSLKLVIKFALEMAAGMFHLHCEGILHRGV
jgi:serine/threonine protein kinase